MLLDSPGKYANSKRCVCPWLTIHRWFAGEAERIQGTVSTPAAPGRRVFTIKQPIGVAVALTPWNFPIVSLNAQTWRAS